MEHTPGKWRYDGCNIYAPGYIVATVNWHTGANHEKANARLIAAAPEMKEALEVFANLPWVITAFDGAEWSDDTEIMDGKRHLTVGDVKKARALLATLGDK